MRIKVKNTDGISIVSFEGDFLSEVDQSKFQERVRGLVEQHRTHLVIDLAHVKHMNSCGLGALVCAFTTVRRAGGDLRLVGTRRFVADVLKLTRLDTIFQTYPSVPAALSEFHVRKN